MSEPKAPWTNDEAATDKVTKKQLVEFLQTHGNNEFLSQHALRGSVVNVTKKAKKDDLVTAYKELFEGKVFRSEKDDIEAKQAKVENASKAKDVHTTHHEKEEKKAKVEVVYFTKTTIKPGDQSTFAKKGETVEIYYTGKLDDGTTFDTNAPAGASKGKAADPAKGAKDDKEKDKDKKAAPEKGGAEKKGKAVPLKVQVGKGKVVRGLDEALTQISKGEKAKVVIPAEHGYGKKGKPDAKIPPNANLTFEVEVVDIY